MYKKNFNGLFTVPFLPTIVAVVAFFWGGGGGGLGLWRVRNDRNSSELMRCISSEN